MNLKMALLDLNVLSQFKLRSIYPYIFHSHAIHIY